MPNNADLDIKQHIAIVAAATNQKAVDHSFKQLETYLKPVLVKIISRKALVDTSADDFYQIALLEIFLACKKYDSNRPVKPFFATIARNIINTELKRGLSAGRYNPSNVSFNKGIGYMRNNDGVIGEGRALTAGDMIEGNEVDPHEALAAADSARYLIRHLSPFLSERERQVLFAYLSRQASGCDKYIAMQKVIAAKFETQIGRKQIDNSLMRIRDKAKKLFTCESLEKLLGHGD